MSSTADIAKFGLMLDASGMQREVRLTTEQLKALSNGGREAEAVMKSIGNPRLAQQIQTSITAPTQTASTGVGKLRGAFTTLAISAGALPGPLGRVASVLAPFAFGGPVTVGVLAGITAMSFAWQKFTEDADAARAMMVEIHKMESSFGPRAMVARAGSLQRQEAGLSGQLAGQQSMIGKIGTDPLSRMVADYVTMWQSSQTKERLADVRERLVQLDDAIADFTRQLAGEAADKRRFMTQTVAVAGWESAAGSAKARQWWNPNAGLDEGAFAATQRASLDYAVNAAKAQREYTGDALKYKLAALEVDRQTAVAIAIQNANLQRGLTITQQKAGAQQMLASYGLGMVAQGMGPFGGMMSGVGSALMSGNMYGAAAAGIMGLISGIAGLGQSSRQAAEDFRRFKVQFASFTDDLRLQVGDITDKEFRIREFKRRAEEERRAILGNWSEARFRGERPAGMEKSVWEAQKQKLDELNDLERRRLEQLGKEADAIDRINNAVRNAPSGFYVERYLRRLGVNRDWESGVGPPISIPSDPGSRRANATASETFVFDLSGSTFALSGANGEQVFESFVRVLKRKARSTGGAGMSLSRALDVS